jgi:hypothetical protein
MKTFNKIGFYVLALIVGMAIGTAKVQDHKEETEWRAY